MSPLLTRNLFEKLYPNLDIRKETIHFPTVQHQPNLKDCGVYAIAFAVSLAFGLKPEKIRYSHHLMQSHLLRMLKGHLIEHFPQDSRILNPQPVFPLSIALQKTLNRVRMNYSRPKSKLKNSTKDVYQIKVINEKFVVLINNNMSAINDELRTTVQTSAISDVASSEQEIRVSAVSDGLKLIKSS